MENFNPLDFGTILGWLSAILPEGLLGVGASELVYRLKILSLFLSTVFSLGIIFVVAEVLKYRPHFVISKNQTSSSVVQTKVAKPLWENILKRLDSGHESDLALAIIEADNLADDMLKRMGILGETMMERLEGLNPAEVASLLGVIDAHRVRNNIAHTPGYKISKEDAKALMNKYEKFFKELEVI